MIKVCHIVNLITGRADGVYAYLETIFRNNDNNKYERIFIFQGNPKIESEVKGWGIRVIVEPLLNKKFSPRALLRLYKNIKNENVDIIHSHMIKPYIMAGTVNIFLKKKHIFNYHGIFIKGNIYYSWYQKIIVKCWHHLIVSFNAVNLFIAPSRCSKELLELEIGDNPTVEAYYTGYDLNKHNWIPEGKLIRELNALKQTGKLIGVIGRLCPEKRVDRAIQIFYSLSITNTNLCLVIVGEGEKETSLKKLAKQLGVDDHVYFTGFQQNIKSCFYLFDCILITSDWEGFPNVVWEAMASKVPVVAAAVGGIPEIFNRHNCGLLFEKNDIDDAVTKLQLILSDYELRNIITENGGKAVEEFYNSKKFMERLDQLYTYLIGNC